MKSLFVVLFSLVSFGLLANNSEESQKPVESFNISNELIAKITSSVEIQKSYTLFSDGPCWSASGGVKCNPPCGGGSMFSTGCHGTSEAAASEAGTLASIICGTCGFEVTYEVSCED